MSRHLKVLVIIVSLVLPEITLTSALAQNLKGIWAGGLTSDTSGVPVINTNYFLHIKEQENNVIRGTAYVIERRYRIEGILDFFGTIKNNVISLHEIRINSSKVPIDTLKLCLKKLKLNIAREKDQLNGPWVGRLETFETCTPGQAHLERFNPGAKTTLMPDWVLNRILLDSGPVRFLNTTLNNPAIVTVNSRLVTISLSDYLREDEDTVSVYYNRESIIQKLKIEKKPYLRRIRIDRQASVNELVVYANNLGQLPPNTCTMIIDDGIRKQRINITSTKQNSAAIYLRYEPPEG